MSVGEATASNWLTWTNGFSGLKYVSTELEV
jgi:hypothetical protein